MVGDAEGLALPVGVVDGFGVAVPDGSAVAPFLSPVMITTFVVPEVEVVVSTVV